MNESNQTSAMKYDASLSQEDRLSLLKLARASLERAVRGSLPYEPDLELLSPALREKGVCFVTLTLVNGDLRGCIGALEARHPLAVDVCQHAAAAALEDYRFQPVRPHELPSIRIEISRLTTPVPLEYECPEDLPRLLLPMVDGLVLRDGPRRATFLPQVWEKLPSPEEFLNHLCQKLGGPANLWQHKKLRAEIYHVEEFHEV